MHIQDLQALAQILAGERSPPAATVVADRLAMLRPSDLDSGRPICAILSDPTERAGDYRGRRRRLALTCHWLTLAEAAGVTGVPADVVATLVPLSTEIAPGGHIDGCAGGTYGPREREKDRGKPANQRTAPGRLVEGATVQGWKAALGALALAHPDRLAPYLT
jgi:hypothetical protein